MQRPRRGSRGTSTWEACANSTTPAEVDMDVAWIAAYSRTVDEDRAHYLRSGAPGASGLRTAHDRQHIGGR